MGYLDRGTAITDTDIIRIRAYVRRRVHQGKLRELAALILVQGKWKGTLWYPIVEEEFAEYGASGHPVAIGAAAERRLKESLVLVARSPQSTRNARVFAAVALRHDDPVLARKVLADTYADFEIGAFDSLYGRIPGSGPYLAEMGVPVPAEITSIQRAEAVLRCDPRYADANLAVNPERLARAANTLNRHLRKLLLSRNHARLEEFLDQTVYARRLGDLYRASAPASRAGESIFDR